MSKIKWAPKCLFNDKIGMTYQTMSCVSCLPPVTLARSGKWV